MTLPVLLRRILLLQLLLSPLAILGQSQNQVSYLNDIGDPAYSTKIPVENGYIDASNGNLHLEFPLASNPQRGALALNERLTYDSRIWLFLPFALSDKGSYHWWPYNVPGTATIPSSNLTSGGWRFVTGQEIGSLLTISAGGNTTSCGSGSPPTPPPPPPGGPVPNAVQDSADDSGSISDMYFLPVWTDPSGTQHNFGAVLETYIDDCDPTQNYAILTGGGASDGSGYQIPSDPGGTIRILDNNGTQVYPSIIDRYGNAWTSDAQGNLIDDTGRIPVITTINGNTTFYDVLSPNGSINNKGLRVRYTVTTAPVNVNTTFIPWTHPDDPFGSAIHGWVSSTDLTPVQSILLPDGVSNYSFTYDINGEMASVTLPTGGIIKYGYTDFVDSANTENMWVTSHTRGSDPAMTLSPQIGTPCVQYSSGCREYTVIHRPSGDESIIELTLVNGAWNTGSYVYTGAAPAQKGVDIFKSKTPSANILMSTATDSLYSNPCAGPTCVGANYPIDTLQTRIMYGGGQAVYTQKETTFDPTTGKPILVDTWDYGSQGALNFTPNAIRTQPTQQTLYFYSGNDLTDVRVNDSSGNMVADTAYSYFNYASPTTGVSQHGTTNSGGPYLHSISRWLNTNPTTPSVTTYTMDDTGMVSSVSDPNGNKSSIVYQCSNSLPFQTTNALNQMTQYGFDCSSGAAVSVQDPNDLASGRLGTTYSYESQMGRPYTVSYPDGGGTTMTYPSLNEADTTISASTPIATRAMLDPYGRPVSSIVGETEVDNTYDATGRLTCTTNPYVGTPGASTCITAFDGLDRPLTVLLQDGISSRTSTYSVNSATNSTLTVNSDETGASWTKAYDSFGKLLSVTEPGGLQTAYSYDGLGNATTITQSGNSQTGDVPLTRSFTYDSLSRLVCASNPESAQSGGIPPKLAHQPFCPSSATLPNPQGVLSYSYDLVGNLSSRLDARGVTTAYSYDALNRINYKRYSDGTPLAAYGYDGKIENGVPVQAVGATSNNAIGRLSTISNEINAATAYSYDAMGRVVLQQQLIPFDLTFTHTQVAATYDGAGSLTSLTYPDNRQIAITWDSSGRLGSPGSPAIADVNTGQQYLQTVTYNPDGSPRLTTLGNAVVQDMEQNGRLQTASLTITDPVVSTSPLLSHTYCYSLCSPASGGPAVAPNNNGAIWQIADLVNGSRTQDFTYDTLSRITSFAVGGTLSQQYSTDSFGNLTGLNNGLPITTFDPKTNRIQNLPCKAATIPYDQAGNQLCDSDQFGGVRQYAYDAEHRMSTVSTLGNTASPFLAYVYGADGNRVLWYAPAEGAFSEYVYFNGQVIAELDQTDHWTDYIYADGKKIAAVPQYKPVIHLQGVQSQDALGVCGTPFYVSGQAASVFGYQVHPGDVLSFDHKSESALVGLWLGYGQGTYGNGSYSEDLTDTSPGTWKHSTLDLQSHVGATISALVIGPGNPNTPVGPWQAWFQNVVITSSDGTVHQLFTGGSAAGAAWGPCGDTVSTFSVDQTQVDSPFAATFYLGDHLASVQMELSGSGAILSSSQFSPFGTELAPQSSITHYKFAGLERDHGTGLDHATFRQYASSVGRWMSADPYGGSMDPNNPQSFNRYSYVGNMPLSLTDPMGLQALGSGDGPSGGGDGGSGGGGLIAEVIWDGISHWLFPPHEVMRESTNARPGNHGDSANGIYYGGSPVETPTLRFAAEFSDNATNPTNRERPAKCDNIPGYPEFLHAARVASAAWPKSSNPVPWLRGIMIHAAFSGLVRSFPNTSVNISYMNGQRAGWLDLGSIRPDAVYGDVNAPTFIIELKTGGARLVNPQLSNYITHLPQATRICEIFERTK